MPVQLNYKRIMAYKGNEQPIHLLLHTAT